MKILMDRILPNKLIVFVQCSQNDIFNDNDDQQ